MNLVRLILTQVWSLVVNEGFGSSAVVDVLDAAEPPISAIEPSNQEILALPRQRRSLNSEVEGPDGAANAMDLSWICNGVLDTGDFARDVSLQPATHLR